MNVFARSVAAMVVTAGAMSAAWGTDWAQWRGPTRDGITAEKFNAAWPKEGPKKLWTAAVGIGCGSVAVADGRVFVMGNSGKSEKDGDANNEDTLYCLSAEDGKEVWHYSYPQPLEATGFEGGPCVTPCVDGKSVYAANKRGRTWCFQAADGKVVWDTKPDEKIVFDPKKPVMFGGKTASPFVAGDLLITASGALNKTDGKTVWTTSRPCNWASPLAVTFGDKSCVLFLGPGGLQLVTLADGKEIAFYPWPSDQNAADPVVVGDTVLLASRRLKATSQQTCLVQLGEGTMKPLWANDVMSYFQNRVQRDGFAYGCDETGLRCMDLKTGETKWSQKVLQRGQPILADGKLIIACGGTVAVVEASPDGFKQLAQAKVTTQAGTSIAPVLANGKLFVRGSKGELVCLDVAAGG